MTILTVHRDRTFDERMRAYYLHGGTALAAAKKAEEIIRRMIDEGRRSGLSFGRRTRKGELRIKHCVKYDLGNGYRMVCLKKERRFIALYIGTHDECSRWIARNKDLTYDLSRATCETIATKEPVTPVFIDEEDAVEAYERELMSRIDDKMLRKIFKGLCESAGSR